MHLRHRAGAEVEVACQAGVAGTMLGSGPDAVVGHRQRIGVDQPCMPLGLALEGAGRGQHVADHPRQERRLRTGQVIGAVGVEHAAVVLDLEQHVVGHVAGQLDAPVRQQAELDEVAVPAVHLVELPARHHVGPGQVEQAFRRQRGRHQVAELFDAPRQRVHVDLATLSDVGHRCGRREAGRQVEHRARIHFRIVQGRAIVQRARQRVPGLVDVCLRLRRVGRGGTGRGSEGQRHGGEQGDDFHGRASSCNGSGWRMPAARNGWRLSTTLPSASRLTRMS